MSLFTVLLVEPHARVARQIADALGTLALAEPAWVRSGEEAIAWLGEHDCDLCLLAYELPGLDGLATLVRLHQRRPALAIIMLAEAKDATVAIAAFRAGVVDYLPKGRGFERAVAQRVQEFVATRPGAGLVPPPPSRVESAPTAVPETYANWFAAIGRQLDLYRYRRITLLEVGGGFIARILPEHGRTPEVLEFTARDFPALVAGAASEGAVRARWRDDTPLFPTGYEECLAALGRRLDGMRAEAVTVTELEHFVAVSGVGLVDDPDRSMPAPFQLLLRPDDILALLEEAERRGPVSRLTRLLRRS